MPLNQSTARFCLLQFRAFALQKTALAADWSNCARAEFPNTCLFLCFLTESLANVPLRDLRLGFERAFGSGYTDFTPDALPPRALEGNKRAHQTPRHISHNELQHLFSKKLGTEP